MFRWYALKRNWTKQCNATDHFIKRRLTLWPWSIHTFQPWCDTEVKTSFLKSVKDVKDGFFLYSSMSQYETVKLKSWTFSSASDSLWVKKVVFLWKTCLLEEIILPSQVKSSFWSFTKHKSNTELLQSGIITHNIPQKLKSKALSN